MGAFDEIVSGGPYAVYIAPEGTNMPGVQQIPPKPWVLMGVNGPLSMTEEGISVTAGQTLSKVFALGTTAPVEVFRTQEEFDVSLALHDLTPENWNRILNGVAGAVNRVPPTATTVGTKHVDLLRGGTVRKFAALIRLDVSPYDSTFKSQFELYRAYQSADQNPTLDKGSTPAVLNVTFSTLFDPQKQTTAIYKAMYLPKTG